MAAKKKRGVPQANVSDEARELARQLLRALDKDGIAGGDSDAAVFARAGIVGLIDGSLAIVGGTIVTNSTAGRARLKRAREVLEAKPGTQTQLRRRMVAAARTALRRQAPRRPRKDDPETLEEVFPPGWTLGMQRVATLVSLLDPIDKAFRVLLPHTETGEMNGKIITLAARMEHANASPVTIAALACKLAKVEDGELDQVIERFKDALKSKRASLK